MRDCRPGNSSGDSALWSQNIPAALRDRPQWVCWKYTVVDPAKPPTKVPFDPRTGQRASSTDPSTWSSFDEAIAACVGRQYDGVGFAFSPDDPFCGIDLDGCFDEAGNIVPAARAIVESFNSYSEVSPSGKGVKIFIVGTKPPGARCRSSAIPGFKQTEVYDKAQYFTVTGNRLPCTPTEVSERQSELEQLCARLTQPRRSPRVRSSPRQTLALDDEAIISKLRRARNADKFAALFDRGELTHHQGNHSSADEALCCMFAYYTRDAAQIERLFSSSALASRDKWSERPDYRDRTIAAALAFVTATATGTDRVPSPAQTEGPSAAAHSGTKATFPCTDLGNAERFAARYADRLRYCHALDVWFVWDGRRWAPDDRGLPLQLAGETARSILGEAQECDVPGTRAELARWAVKSENRTRLDAMVALAKSQPALTVVPAAFDRDIWLFNTMNGTIDLRTGELGPHSRDDLITRISPVHFDPNAPCPLFDAFLNRVLQGDQDLISYLQRFFGYCLSGDIDLQVVPILLGSGANGKSVLIDTIKYIMAEYACDAAPTLLIKSGREEHPTEIADLLARRCVVASETEEGAVLKLQLLKRMTGDRTLKGRKMHRDFFEFPRTHKTVMVTNNRPRVNENSHAVWRRVNLVPFQVVIPESERIPDLIERLKAEAPGILAWLVRGCLDYRNVGLKPPKAVLQATEGYQASEDTVQRFLAECCILDGPDVVSDSRSVTRCSVLYEAYTTWCHAQELTPLGDGKFGAALNQKGIDVQPKWLEGGTVKVRCGVHLVGSR